MTEEFKKQIEMQARQAVTELLAEAKLKKGDVFVVGCSSSEIVGGHIGKDSSLEAAQAVYAGIALRAGRNLQEKLFSLPADASCAEAVDTADGSWKRTVSSKGAGGVTALCPVESRLYLGLAGSEKVRSANL